MPKGANLIKAGKAIIEEGLTLKPTLTVQQVKILCFALGYLDADLDDDNLRATFREKIGNRGAPLSEEACHDLIHQLIRDVGGQVVYGPNYYETEPLSTRIKFVGTKTKGG